MQIALPGQYVVQIVAVLQAQDQVRVGQSQVHIHQNHTLAGARCRNGQVRRQCGLAHAALAAGDGNGLGDGAGF